MWCEKILNFAILQSKLGRNEGGGRLENADMQFFSITILFLTLMELPGKWAKNRPNYVPPNSSLRSKRQFRPIGADNWVCIMSMMVCSSHTIGRGSTRVAIPLKKILPKFGSKFSEEDPKKHEKPSSLWNILINHN